MRKADRIFGIIGLGLSLWCYLESSKFHYMTKFDVVPAYKNSAETKAFLVDYVKELQEDLKLMNLK